MSAPVRIAALADWLHPRGNLWKAMVMLKAYFDESGTHGGSAITAIAGYVGSKDVWASIEDQWLDILKPYADKGVRYFHCSECIAQEGQFSRIDKPNTDFILTNLSEILGQHDVHPISSAVVVDDWNEVITDAAFLRRFSTPFDLCFEDVVRQLWEWARRKVRGERVCPMFAYHQEFSPRMADIGRAYGAESWYRAVLGPIAFGYQEEVVPLQAADLIAHQVNWDTERRAYEPIKLGQGGPTQMLLNAAPRGIVSHWFSADSLALVQKRFAETGEIYPLWPSPYPPKDKAK